eukprot:SAG11_NODE_1216_length_5501_cov_2.800629_9_plen_204_part_00
MSIGPICLVNCLRDRILLTSILFALTRSRKWMIYAFAMRRVLVEGAKSSQFVEHVEHWGPGYPEYFETRSLRRNIYGKFGDDEYFDVVFTCGDNIGSLSLEFEDSRVVVALRKHECRQGSNPRCDDTIQGRGVDIVALVNPFEVGTNVELHSSAHDLALVHIFSPTTLPMYKPVASDAQSGRNVDLLLLGSTLGNLYPLRIRW